MPSAEAVIGALTRPETWPDYASELGRFTPLRPGGLLNQTFEIDLPMRVMFDDPTIAALSLLIEEALIERLEAIPN